MVVVRRISDIVKELDVAVHTLSSYPDMNNRHVTAFWYCLLLPFPLSLSCSLSPPSYVCLFPALPMPLSSYMCTLPFSLVATILYVDSDSLKMEVGIEDCLHIEFEYNKSK